MREQWYPDGEASFSVDHFIPQVSGRGVLNYDNLLYVCLRCNSYKRDIGNLLNPRVHPFASHLRINRDGTVTTVTTEGKILDDTLRLNNERRV